MTTAARVITNHVPRFTIDAFELNEAERAQFDYIDWQGIENGTESATFFRYRGTMYDLGQFTTTNPGPWNFLPADSPLLAWDGYLTDSFSSAIVVRYVDDGEAIIAGTVLS